MANGGKITFGVGFDVDPSGLNNLKQSFKELKQLTPTDLLKINPSFEGDMKKAKSAWGEIQSTVVRVDHAIDEAFNTDLGVLNINKLNASLERIGVDKIRNSFANAGVAGQRAFNGIAEKALTTNVRLRETETILDSMGKTMMNTIKWGMTSGIWNNFTNGAQQAYGYVKHLDSSLNDIRIVTGKSAEEMDKFAEKANKAAKSLGSSTTDYTEAALIYYQQGLSDKETAARAETTIKAANVTGQSGEAVSEQLTAVWNGYKVSAEEAELYIDKLAAVAATTASDLEELSTGMSKVASAAAIMGVDIDQLNAQLATIVSVTREAPESIGTALKTVYARMSDITAGLDGEVSLDEYTQQMEAMGIHVLDANGNLRDMGDVIEEIGGKWQSMSREQQTSLAQTIAGTRQYSRMMSLFDNWDMYTKALETSANAAGTLNKQNEIYLDSAEAHLKQLRTTTEDLYHSLLDADTIKDVADIFTFLIDKVDMFVDAVGGGSGALAGLGMIITKLFSKQIAQGIEPLITNMQGLKQNAEQLKAVMQNVNTFATGEGYTTKATEAMRAAQLEISKYWNVMSAEEINASQEAIREIGRITQMKEEWEAATKAAKEYMMTHAPSKGGRSKDEQGNIINKAAQKDLAKADYSRGWAGIEEDIAAGGDKGKAAQRVKDTYEMQTAAAEKLLKTEKEIEQIISKKVNAQSKLSGLLDVENGNIQEQSQLIEGIKNDLKEAKETGLINEQEYDYAIQKANELLKKLTDAKKKLEEDSSLSVKDLGIDKEAIDEVISEMYGAVNQSSESLQGFNNRMNDSSKASLQLSAAQDQLNISILKTRQTIANITKALNTFSNVAMGLNAIKGIFNIWSNEDASTFEKIASTMMSLSMIVPMLTSAYSGLVVVMNAVNIAQGKYVVVAGKMVAADTAQAFAEGILTAARHGDAAALEIVEEALEDNAQDRLSNTAAINAETAALIANTAAQKGNKEGVNLLDGATDDGGAGTLVDNIKSIPDKLKEIPGKITDIGKKISKGAKGIGTAVKATFAGTATAATVAAVALGAVAIAAVAATAVVIAHRVALQNEAKEAQRAADKAIDHAEGLREEKEAIDAITSSYKKLSEQYENGEISLDELRTKTAELCTQYGEQDLALKALIGDYQILSQVMDEAQQKTNEEVAEAEKTTQEAIEDAVIKNIKADAKGRLDSFGTTIDLKGMVGDNKQEEKLRTELEDLGVIFEHKDKINLESFVDAYLQNSEELIDVLNAYSDESAARQLLDLIAGQNENLEAYKASQEIENDIVEQQLADLSFEIYDKEIVATAEKNEGQITNTQSLEAYQKAEENYVTKRLADLGLKEGDKGYQEALDKATEDFRNFALQHDALVEEVRDASIYEALGDEYLSYIDTLSEDEKNYIYLHLDTVEAYGNLDKFLKDYEDIIKNANTHSIVLEIDTLLKDSDKESFSNEELASFYQAEDAEQTIGMSLGELKSLDFKEQRMALMAATQEMKAELLHSNQELFKAIQSTTKEKENQLEEEQNAFYQKYKDVLNIEKEEVEEIHNQVIDIRTSVSDAFSEEINQPQTDSIYSSLLSPSNDWEATENSLNQLGMQAIATQTQIAALKQEILDMNQTAANSAQSLGELDELWETGAIRDVETTDGVDEGRATYNQRANELYEVERLEDLDADILREYSDHLQDISENSEEFSDELVDNKAAARDLAVQITRMNKGVEALSSNWEEWSDILNNSTKGSEEYFQTLNDAKDAMADLLDVSSEFISEDLIVDNMEDIAKAAEGDAEAIDNLRDAMLEDIIVQIATENNIDVATLQSLVADAQAVMPDLEVGATLDDGPFIDALNHMIEAANMTTPQVNAMLSGMGYDVNYEEQTQEQQYSVPVYTTYETVTDGPTNITLADGSVVSTYAKQHWTEQTGTKQYTGEFTTSAMVTSEPGTTQAPKINSVTKKASGSANNSSSGNKGGGKSGGGGGGGGSKAPDRKKYIEDEVDRYHDVNIELKELATAYDRLGKAQEKLTSGALIDNLNEQLEILQKQILTYKEKLKLMEEEKSELQGELGAQGVQFSEDGSISNYNDALINRLNQANAEIDRYNQMTAEQQEATKDADGKTLADRATEDYEAFKEALDRYDTLTSEEIPELQDSIQDAIDQQIEIQIQKFNMGIEVQLDMAEATKEFNEWKAKVIDGLKDDDLLGNTKLTMENMQIYFDPSQGEGLMTQTASHLQQVMDEIAVMQSGGTSDIYGDNMAAAMEDLTKYQEELMNQTTEWADYVQEVQDNYLEMIDEANDKIDEQRENYEFINNQLEHSLSIIEKMHGDGAYEEMAQIYKLQRQSYEEQLAFQRQEVELWAQRMEEARLSGDTEALEKYTENWKDAQEELDSLVEAALDNLLTEYENAVNLAFDKLNEKVTSGMGLDYVSEEWELANQNAEMYLDTINEAFAIDQLRNKYQKSINETSNLDTQKKLNDLMEKEIAALEKKDKLTQYDVERANMKYDIALKQIALEEAQQNKTTMRLKRDSQGNYTYQYTSDDDAVADAQQQLAEAQNSLYNFDKENYQNNLDQMLSVYTEFQQKMAEAALINDEEQRQARMLMLQEQYGQLINGITAENEVIRYNLHESAFDELATNVYGKNVEEFYNMSQEEQNEIMSGLVPTWEGGVQQMADAFSDGFLPTCQETFDQIDVGYEELKAGMSAVAEQAGIDFQTYADGTQPAIDKMKELVQDNKDVVTEMGNQLSSMQALRDQALEMDDAYAPYLKAVADLVGKSQNLRQAEADVTTELSKQKTTLDDLTVSFSNAIAKLKEYNNTPVQSKDTGGGGGGGSTGGYSGGTTTDNTPKERWGVFGQKSNKRVAGPFSTKGDADREATAQQGKNKWFNGQNRQWEIEGLLVKQYDTGGYTGEWAGGSQKENGRLAMLHQKELVLNEQDTANFLTAIQITRGMSGVLESVANKMASIGSTFSSNVANTSNGIQQQITINADFPDATSATEIEEALLSLVNRASQQAFNVNI